MKAIVGIILVIFISTAYASSLFSFASEALLADAKFQGAEAAWRAGIEKAPQGRAGLLPQIGVQQVMYRNGISVPGQISPSYSTVGFTLTLNQPLFNLAAWETYQQGQLLAMDSGLA
jgi:outer membrane protein